MNKNQKIGIGIGIAAIVAFVLYKKGVFGGSNGGNGGDGGSTEAPASNLPIVDVSSGSETPQVAVVNIPPQFGGGEVVTASNIPTYAGSYGSYA
jgi:hypothetical protein